MNAQGLKRCIEEKESMSSRNAELVNQCASLKMDCSLYERDIERLMDSYDELARENEDLKRQLQDNSVSLLSCRILIEPRFFSAWGFQVIAFYRWIR